MKTLNYKKPVQLSLFGPTTIRTLKLKAPASPRKAFYNISLLYDGAGFVVQKESGANSKQLDRRAWDFKTFEHADKFFNRKIREKTVSKSRKRAYQIITGV